jgi:hypothetical protein
MEYSESILTELYTWCFQVSPDTVVGNEASLTGSVGSVTIYESTDPNAPNVWCVSASSDATTITAFEVDLAIGIENFKSAWTDRNNPT